MAAGKAALRVFAVSPRIAIFGLGRVGLPLGLYFARQGATVYGVDHNAQLVETLRRGRMPFLEEQGEEFLQETLGKTFFPTTTLDCVAETESIILTLGTPVDEHLDPVFSELEQGIASLLPHFRKGQLLVLRSTVAPGTTEGLKRHLEQKTSFRVGEDLFLSFCPERIAEGQALQEIPEVPQIIGGVDAESTRRSEELFRLINSRLLLTDATSAELAKLFCNMYRYIDFAIGNEFFYLTLQHGRNMFEILDLINRDYKRGGLKPPGLTGGPCLYKDGFFLVTGSPFNDLISAAWKINETVPYMLINELKKHIPLQATRVALLGLGFKRNIDDDRNSLSRKVQRLLLKEGSQVSLHDPFLHKCDLAEVLSHARAVMICTNHDFYQQLGLEGLRRLAPADAFVCDIWNLFGVGKLIYVLKETE